MSARLNGVLALLALLSVSSFTVATSEVTGCRGGRFRVRRVILSCLVVIITPICGVLSSGKPAIADTFVIQTSSDIQGGDTCSAPTISQMQTLWNQSPLNFDDFNIYYAGGNRCDTTQSNLTTTWMHDVGGFNPRIYPMSFNLIPTNVSWTLPYKYCTEQSNPYQLDSNLSRDYSLGGFAASDGINQAVALGITSGPLYLDIEDYYPNNTYGGVSCRSIADNFIQGYTDYLSGNAYYRAGVYVSSCSGVTDYASFPHPPQDVWLANWDGRLTTWGIGCVPDSYWYGDQRIHQFTNQSPTWSPVSIDRDCENGDVTGQTPNETPDSESTNEDPGC
ncbi:MAG TPA: glycoside hydrolase domain-containing protein [Candidatus Dormibacteraeota bacterium]|nr:glycoside hydrolase domain-containing protein [Candidatus Dormibacteraeota bacterium]